MQIYHSDVDGAVTTVTATSCLARRQYGTAQDIYILAVLASNFCSKHLLKPRVSPPICCVCGDVTVVLFTSDKRITLSLSLSCSVISQFCLPERVSFATKLAED